MDDVVLDAETLAEIEARAKAAADLLAMLGASVPADALRRDIPLLLASLRSARAENERQARELSTIRALCVQHAGVSKHVLLHTLTVDIPAALDRVRS